MTARSPDRRPIAKPVAHACVKCGATLWANDKRRRYCTKPDCQHARRREMYYRGRAKAAKPR